MIFAHSKRDIFLVLVSLFTTALYVVLAFAWPHLEVLVKLLSGALLIFLICTNYQCVAHNFLHNPFFKSRRLNYLFSIFNSIALGMPQTLYKFHHFNHHRYGNDRKDPETGQTKDRSSTYAYSRDQDEEPLVSYAVLGVARTNLNLLYSEAKSKKQHRLVHWEIFVSVALFTLLLAINWQYFLTFVLPVWFLGQAAALAENYLEHHKADPDNLLTNSVSCYNSFYNLLWFNNGYHQEHHCKPSIHWTKIKQIRDEMLPNDKRRVVKVAHWFNF